MTWPIINKGYNIGSLVSGPSCAVVDVEKVVPKNTNQESPKTWNLPNLQLFSYQQGDIELQKQHQHVNGESVSVIWKDLR